MCCEVYTIVKYSEIKSDVPLNWNNAVGGMRCLLLNGFTNIDGYFEIEVNKLIKALKDLNLQHTMKFVESKNHTSKGNYEFSLNYFVDDRNIK